MRAPARRATQAAWVQGLLVAALVFSPSARADAPTREPTKSQLTAARGLFAHAQEDEDGGRWADALEKLKRASNVKMTPGIRFHIALCEEKLGQLATALGDYVAAESAARSENNREVLDAVAEPLASLRTRVPHLIVNLPPDAKEAEVMVDGLPLPVGLWSTPMPIEVGAHLVQARAAARTPFAEHVTIAERETLTLDIRLPPVAKPLGETSAAAPLLPTESAPGAAAQRPTGGTHGTRTAAIVATAGAVALVGAGVAAYATADGKQSDARAACATRTSCDDLKGPIHTWDALALAGWLGGAALGAFAVILWVSPPRGANEIGVSARASATPGGFRIEGAF
jgi:hypothetical protein